MIFFLHRNDQIPVVKCGYLLKVKSDTPAVKGSVVHFTADLYESNGARVKLGDITYKWVIIIDYFYLHGAPRW